MLNPPVNEAKEILRPGGTLVSILRGPVYRALRRRLPHGLMTRKPRPSNESSTSFVRVEIARSVTASGGRRRAPVERFEPGERYERGLGMKVTRLSQWRSGLFRNCFPSRP